MANITGVDGSFNLKSLVIKCASVSLARFRQTSRLPFELLSKRDACVTTSATRQQIDFDRSILCEVAEVPPSVVSRFLYSRDRSTRSSTHADRSSNRTVPTR